MQKKRKKETYGTARKSKKKALRSMDFIGEKKSFIERNEIWRPAAYSYLSQNLA